MSMFYRYDALSEILSIKAPLLMLDQLIVDPEAMTAEGVKMVSFNEDVFNGHFPDYPVLPGMLQIAAMAQVCRILFQKCSPGDGIPTVKSLRRVKFRTPVTPGMALRIHCAVHQKNDDGTVEFEIKNRVNNGDLASSGFITFTRRDETWFTPPPNLNPCPFLAEPPASVFNPLDILRYIPHRHPFMLIDKAYGLEDMNSAVGYKNITGCDPLVQATRPALYPAYLQIESGAQLGCATMLSQPQFHGLIGFFMSVDDAEFFRPVLPGEQLAIKAACEPKGTFGIATGHFMVGDATVARATIKFALVNAAAAKQ